MCKPRPGRAIADCPQALGFGAAVGINLDKTAIYVRELLYPDVLRIGHDADGNDAMRELMFSNLAVLTLDLGLHALGVRLDIFNTCTGHDCHALFGQ